MASKAPDTHTLVVAGLVSNTKAVEHYARADYSEDLFYEFSERTEMTHGKKENIFIAHCALEYYEKHAELVTFSYVKKMLLTRRAGRARIASYKKKWNELRKHRKIKLGEWKERLDDLIFEYREFRHKVLTREMAAFYTLRCMGNYDKKEEKCRTCDYKEECKLMIKSGERDRSIFTLDHVATKTEQIKLDTMGTSVRIYNVTEILPDGVEQLRIDKLDVDEDGNRIVKGLPTPFPKLTENIGGWMDKRLYMFASRSGIGKSALLLQCGNVAATAGHLVLEFNLEMPVLEELRYRIMAYLCGVSFEALMTKQVSDETIAQVQEGVDAWINTIEDNENYQIVDIPLQTKLTTIFRMVDNFLAKHGRKDVLVIIDYFNLLYVPPNVQRPDLYWGQLAEQLHGFARAREIPILSALQLNRSAEGVKRLTAKHLRDADKIMDNLDGMWGLLPLSDQLLRLQCVKGRYFQPRDFYLRKELWKMGFSEFKRSEPQDDLVDDSEDEDEEDDFFDE